MREIILLAAGGALGTVSRYAVSTAATRFFGPGFPVGTLLVNMLGCALLGFLMYLGLNSHMIPAGLRLAATVGFLGAFTTFSTFSYETVNLIGAGDWHAAMVNIFANLVFGATGTLTGLGLGRLFLRM
jgi:fluoride exporter